MRNVIFPAILLTLLPLAYSCATAPKNLMRNDPLIGKTVQTATRGFVNFTVMMDILESHDVIYLSEKHDNPMHHTIQHRIIQDLVDKGRTPIIGFEFFSFHGFEWFTVFVSGQANRRQIAERDPESRSAPSFRPTDHPDVATHR